MSMISLDSDPGPVLFLEALFLNMNSDMDHFFISKFRFRITNFKCGKTESGIIELLSTT